MSSRRVNVPILVGGLALAVALVALLASGFGRDPHALPSMLESHPAPPFALVDLDGKPWDLASLRGRPVVLNFWSTWCQPCKLEHPLLQEAARATPEVVWLGVLYGDEPEKARRFLASGGSTYPTLVDPEGRVAIDYGVTGVPETFFVDADGVILRKVTGPLSGPALAELLGRMGVR